MIVKPRGKNFGFKYFDLRIRVLWKPSAKMDIVDLDNDYYIVNFANQADFVKALTGGPWYIKKSYITVQLWEPNFTAKHDTPCSSAIWVRLPQLPIEYYDQEVLTQIGNSIGKLIQINARTANSERGRYTRLCIQFYLNKPPSCSINIDLFSQPLQYEGLACYFQCSIVDHDDGKCLTHVQGQPTTSLLLPERKLQTLSDKPSNSAIFPLGRKLLAWASSNEPISSSGKNSKISSLTQTPKSSSTSQQKKTEFSAS